jgi:hypothetical protein
VKNLNQQTIKSLYSKLETKRRSYLDSARDSALLTLPYTFPAEGFSESDKLPTPNQSLGAKGVKQLANKLMNALFPSDNSPFFALEIDDSVTNQLNADQVETISQQMRSMENQLMTTLEQKSCRVQIYEALKQLIVGGNTMLYLPDEGGLKIFNLAEYVVRRDRMGNVLEIIIHESISPLALPDDINITTDKEQVDLYTRILRVNGSPDVWEVTQEVDELAYPPATGTYPLDEFPWIPLRWTTVSGESYGRGFIEEIIADLTTLDGLRYNIKEFAAIASRLVGVVSPASGLDPQDINDAENGEFLEGDAAGVSFLQANKLADFQVVANTAMGIQQDLSQSFLMASSVQRQAERVTAEEIRAMIDELEAGLGGLYAVLAQEMQLPLVKRLLAQLTKKKGFAGMPKSIKITIVSGLEGLSRSAELNKIAVMLQMLQPFPQIAQRLKADNFILRLADALGINNISGLVESQQEADAKAALAQQQAAMQQTLQTALPDIIKSMSDQQIAAMKQAQPQQSQGQVNQPAPPQQ